MINTNIKHLSLHEIFKERKLESSHWPPGGQCKGKALQRKTALLQTLLWKTDIRSHIQCGTEILSARMEWFLI